MRTIQLKQSAHLDIRNIRSFATGGRGRGRGESSLIVAKKTRTTLLPRLRISSMGCANNPHEHIDLDNFPRPVTKALFFSFFFFARITIVRVGEEGNGSATTFRYLYTNDCA